jgi:hypothetical protein
METTTDPTRCTCGKIAAVYFGDGTKLCVTYVSKQRFIIPIVKRNYDYVNHELIY